VRRVIRRPGLILAVLTGLNLVNYIDRYQLAAVGPRLIRDLSLTDAEFGWVGNAFMGGYFLTSPIFGALGDRQSRRWLLAMGVALWSVATAGTGLATSLATVMAMRFLVGTGEASYATIAPTIIDDLAPAERKNRWLSVFYVAIPVGAALGYLGGGLLERAFGWRHAFWVTGAPGLLLALLCVAIAEPARQPHAHGRPLADLGTLVKTPVYFFAVLGYTAYTAALGAFALWAPTYLERRLGLELTQANVYFGGVVTLTGLGGTFLGAWLADRGPDRGPGAHLHRNLVVCAVGALVGGAAAAVAFTQTSLAVLAVSGIVAQLALFTSTSPINVVILGAVPEGLRASAMALSIFAIHAGGDLVSQPLVGALSDRHGIGLAMLAVIPPYLLAATLLWGIAARRAKRRA
jgi:MFS family permease